VRVVPKSIPSRMLGSNLLDAAKKDELFLVGGRRLRSMQLGSRFRLAFALVHLRDCCDAAEIAGALGACAPGHVQEVLSTRAWDPRPKPLPPPCRCRARSAELAWHNHPINGDHARRKSEFVIESDAAPLPFDAPYGLNSNKGTKSDMESFRTSYAQRNYAYVAPLNYRRDSSSQCWGLDSH
jgi:hypothetical protein